MACFWWPTYRTMSSLHLYKNLQFGIAAFQILPCVTSWLCRPSINSRQATASEARTWHFFSLCFFIVSSYFIPPETDLKCQGVSYLSQVKNIQVWEANSSNELICKVLLLIFHLNSWVGRSAAVLAIDSTRLPLVRRIFYYL